MHGLNMENDSDRHFMQRALREARRGVGRTSPNPAVGAVIVRDGQIVGKGFHKKAGTPHAEIHALREAGENAYGATAYVTLEPCNHTGRTPPCTHALLAAGVSRVVAGMLDPNPKVNGSGMAFLASHGIATRTGVMEEECRAINYPFIKFITTGLPWIVMKAGMSLDGKLNYQSDTSGWMTGVETRKRVHQLRNQYDAILVGRKTVEIDNPELNVRYCRNGRDPVRVVLDSQLSVPLQAKFIRNASAAATIIFCAPAASPEKERLLVDAGVIVHRVESRQGGLNLKQVARRLTEHNVLSVLVEGGAAVHGSFLTEQLYDFAHLFYGSVIAGDKGNALLSGYSAASRDMAVRLTEQHSMRLGEDFEITGRVRYPIR